MESQLIRGVVQTSANSVDRLQQHAEVASYVISKRYLLPYMDVARAMVVRASLVSDAEANSVAEVLCISRQTRHNWLKKDLDEWICAWQRRILAKDPVPEGTNKPRRFRTSDDDWQWIANVLSRCIQSASWAKKANAIHVAARKTHMRDHLMTISRVTLWKARWKISGLMPGANSDDPF